jgi:DNA-binding response OmpR family regulator
MENNLNNILKSLNILLVEDEPDIRGYYKEVFEYFFAIVYTANNGEDALEIYNNKNISAIFTDYAMPIMDGYQFIQMIRKTNQNIPITIISNYDDRDKLQKCIPLNLSGYLFKPLDYSDLKKYLHEFSEELLEKGILEYKIDEDCVLITSKNTLKIKKFNYTLTNLESLFLNLLLINKNTIVLYDIIYEYLYNFEPTLSTIKNLVYRLKTKYQFDYIKNISNVGYILVINEN